MIKQKNEDNIAAYVNTDGGLLGAKYTDNAVDSVENKGLSDIYTPFGSNIDGVDGDKYALYASAKGLKQIAISAKSGVEKSVRSDRDVAGAFKSTATVAYGGTYTYQISISNASQSTSTEGSTLHNIIAFDDLENGVSERFETEKVSNTSVFSGLTTAPSSWKGTIQEINLNSVEYGDNDGVAVYYTNSSDVDIPTLTDLTSNMKLDDTTNNKHYRLCFYPTDNGATYKLVLREVTIIPAIDEEGNIIAGQEAQITWGTETKSIGTEIDGVTWYRAEISNRKVDFTNESGVTAFAVDFGDYELSSMKQLVFDVKMKAPSTEQTDSNGVIIKYAYNNPAYYSTIKETETVASLDGNAIKVGIGKEDTLTIAKQFTGKTLENCSIS